jgi:hypothetical protein
MEKARTPENRIPRLLSIGVVVAASRFLVRGHVFASLLATWSGGARVHIEPAPG